MRKGVTRAGHILVAFSSSPFLFLSSRQDLETDGFLKEKRQTAKRPKAPKGPRICPKVKGPRPILLFPCPQKIPQRKGARDRNKRIKAWAWALNH